MDAVEFFREYARMFKTLRKGVTITNMYITVEGVLPPSQEVSFECSTTKDEIDKVINWSKNHPRKTRLQDFKEKFQNAPVDEDGYPECLCPWHLGFEHEDCSGKHCHECRNKPIE